MASLKERNGLIVVARKNGREKKQQSSPQRHELPIHDWILVQTVFVFEHVRLNIPDELVGYQVRLFRNLFYELLHEAQIVVSCGLDKLRNVEENRFCWIRAENADLQRW